MLAPALAGYDVAHRLAADPGFGLPVISHPAFSGANVVGRDCGFSHGFYFGTLQRLMGVDAASIPISADVSAFRGMNAFRSSIAARRRFRRSSRSCRRRAAA